MHTRDKPLASLLLPLRLRAAAVRVRPRAAQARLPRRAVASWARRAVACIPARLHARHAGSAHHWQPSHLLHLRLGHDEGLPSRHHACCQAARRHAAVAGRLLAGAACGWRAAAAVRLLPRLLPAVSGLHALRPAILPLRALALRGRSARRAAALPPLLPLAVGRRGALLVPRPRRLLLLLALLLAAVALLVPRPLHAHFVAAGKLRHFAGLAGQRVVEEVGVLRAQGG